MSLNIIKQFYMNILYMVRIAHMQHYAWLHMLILLAILLGDFFL